MMCNRQRWYRGVIRYQDLPYFPDCLLSMVFQNLLRTIRLFITYKQGYNIYYNIYFYKCLKMRRYGYERCRYTLVRDNERLKT